ncbi:Os04g0623650, partial [Oryza sativa Japonica Group]
LQPRTTADPVALGDDVAARDLLHRRAAAERHGDLQLVSQHPQRVPHAGLAVDGEGEQHRPTNLTEQEAYADAVS